MCLKIQNLSVGYGEKEIVSGISLEVGAGKVMAVLGANGCGKTTFIKTVCGILPPINGNVCILGHNISGISRRNIGRLAAYVPQNHNCTFSFSVREMAVMGRNPFLKGYKEPSEYDYKIVDDALNTLNITHLKNRKFTNLSGGEKKLVLIARALVQQPKLLIMDEPTSDLDLNNTINVLDRILKLKQNNISIVINTHSPKEAKVYADTALMIKQGKVYKYGSSKMLNDPDILDGLYSIDKEGMNLNLVRFIRETA